MTFHRVNKVCLAPQDRMAHLDPWLVCSSPLFPPPLSPTGWMCDEFLAYSVTLGSQLCVSSFLAHLPFQFLILQ